MFRRPGRKTVAKTEIETYTGRLGDRNRGARLRMTNAKGAFDPP